MKYPVPRYLLIPILAACLAFPFAETVSAASGPASGATLTFPRSRSANVGIIIHALDSDKDVVCRNPDKFLTPASILKCVTAASVIADGKENDCFFTESFITGPIDSVGRLQGNLVIKGVGDPTLGSEQFPENDGMLDSIASELQNLGIREICGSILIDSIGFSEQGPVRKWEVEDLKWAYGAGLYPINFRDNTYGVDRAVRHPDKLFTQSLTNRLTNDSIKICGLESGDELQERTLIYSHPSPPASRIMRIMIEQSNNMYAEGMLRFLKPDGTIADALDREREILTGVGLNCDDLMAFDGSGLTRNSKVTPRFMSDLLQTMATGDKGELYLSFFPKAGVEGTVKKLLKGTRLEGRLALKSGSMNGVQCFAGYKLDENGQPTHSVVIMVNDFICKRAYVMKAISDFLLKQF